MKIIKTIKNRAFVFIIRSPICPLILVILFGLSLFTIINPLNTSIFIKTTGVLYSPASDADEIYIQTYVSSKFEKLFNKNCQVTWSFNNDGIKHSGSIVEIGEIKNEYIPVKIRTSKLDINKKSIGKVLNDPKYQEFKNSVKIQILFRKKKVMTSIFEF